MKRKRGRPRKDGPRDDNGRLIKDDPSKHEAPPLHIIQRRALFAELILDRPPQFVTNAQGELRAVDNTSDGIGQLWLLGLLDGHGFDDQDLRDTGRWWRDAYVELMGEIGSHACAPDERVCGSKDWARHAVGWDRMAPWSRTRFDRMDMALTGFDRSALMSLLIDPVVGSWPSGEEEAPWVRAIVGEALIARHKVPKMVRFPDAHDRELLKAAIRGLCALKDASLPSRWERAA